MSLNLQLFAMPQRLNHHPNFALYDMPASVKHTAVIGTQIYDHPQMRFPLDTPQISVHPQLGVPHLFLPGQGTQILHQTNLQAAGPSPHQGTSPLDAYTCRSSSHAAAITLPLAPDCWTFYGTPAPPSQPAQSVLLEDASHADAPPPQKETGHKKLPPACPFPECQRKFTRRQELERHVLQHLPRCLFCPQPGCNWTGRRRDALRGHLKRKHSTAVLPGRGYAIYDAKKLVKQVVDKAIAVELAQCEARLSFHNKAVKMGMLGLWRE
ncbi:hypothetical protein F5148DRAFT_469857 [Russula earlei]|uniref:Uncharacterized protein n=1 Tax=Russula earlei TaxID=71964 RepID=A0ACC0UN76_9AGAM|nr:hypothetical protein F5148DRAFT_469857 [Russula earlei]